jgi:hypothetical protein
MMQVKDQDNNYYLDSFGQLVVEPIIDPTEAYTVKPKDFSDFEKEVADFLERTK